LGVSLALQVLLGLVRSTVQFRCSKLTKEAGMTVAYCVEIVPFNIRAKGLAILYGCKATASIFNQYVNPIGLEHLGWKYYFVYIAILCCECVIIWFYFVETKGAIT
jgi:predicted MFS family arabinose efflux permease